MPSYPHLIAGVAALAATLGVSGFTINRQVKRRLRLSIFLLSVYLLVYAGAFVAGRLGLAYEADVNVRGFANLAFAAALINLLVIGLLNPLREDRVPERFPTILQDAIIIGLVLLVAMFSAEKFMTTSAVSAVVIGFALQDTLGNAFAGLALQSEKPFHLGDWVRVANFEGRVAEITWRATKLRTKAGNLVVLPNNVLSKEAIVNFSEPASATRLEVEVGASYLVPPNDVKAALFEALANASRALKAPAPDVLIVKFDDSAITYRVRFWIDDYARDDAASDEVRSAIYYSFARHGIEIPWPIQIQYYRRFKEPDRQAEQRQREQLLGAIDLFAALSDEERREIAEGTSTETYGNGEAIVRQGDPGQSMFVICSGSARVVLEPDRHEVAVIEAGGYFGEMSLLTGDPRSATVLAKGDTVVVELSASQFRRLGAHDPKAVEQIGVAAMTRRAALEQFKSAAKGAAVADAPATFLARMRSFLKF